MLHSILRRLELTGRPTRNYSNPEDQKTWRFAFWRTTSAMLQILFNALVTERIWAKVPAMRRSKSVGNSRSKLFLCQSHYVFEVGPAEVRLSEVGPAKVGPGEIGLGEVGPIEVGLGEVGRT